MGNKNEGSDTAINENGASFTDNKGSVETRQANETAVTNDHDIALEMSQNTCHENEMKGQYESEITNDDNDVTPRQNDEEKNGNSSDISSCESNEATNNPSRERQVMRQHTFYIHSQWLAVQSSYFRSLLFSQAREPNATEVHVQILASDEKAYLMLLEAMYKINTLDNANLDELLNVLKLAHKCDAKFVFRKCQYCLQSMVPSIEMFEKIMSFKVDHLLTNIEHVEKLAQSFLAKEFSPLDKKWQTESFKKLSNAMLRLLLSSNELVTVNENTVFHALMHWIEQHGIEKILESQELPSLLSVVRFELMPIDYLYCIVQHHSVARKLPDFKEHYLRGITYHALSRRLPRPTVRKNAAVESFIPYTWTITANELDHVVQSGKRLKLSDAFWYCGYKIVLAIGQIVKIRDLEGNRALFRAKLSLVITNLTEQSEVTIRWKATSLSFTSFVEKTFKFTKKASVSSFEIRYDMKVTQQQSSRNVTETMPELMSSTATTPEPPLQASDDPKSYFLQSNVNTSPATETVSGFTSSTPSTTASGGLNFTFPQTRASTSTRTTTATGFTSTTPPSTTSSGLNFTFPQTRASTSTRTTTATGFTSTTPPSTSSSGLNFTFPQTRASTSTRTTTATGFTSTTPPSTTSSGLNFTFPQTRASTSTRTTTATGFTSTTPPSTSSSGLNFTFPQTRASTSTRTTTATGFTSTTPPSTTSSGLNFTFPQTRASTRTRTTTATGFTSSTPPSTTSSGLNFTFPQTRASTSTRTTTATGFTSSTPPSTTSSGLNFTFPQTRASTSTRTTTATGFTSSTPPSTTSSGLNFTFPQTRASTSTRTTTATGFTSTTPPSTTSSGLNFTFPQTSASTSTSTRTTTASGFTSSTPPSTSSSGPNFTFPQSNVSTNVRTTAVSGSTSSARPSTTSGGLNFTFPQSSEETSGGTTTVPSTPSSILNDGFNFTYQSAGTVTMPKLTNFAPPSTLSSGFNVGVLRTSASEANSSRVISRNMPRRYRNRDNKLSSLTKQKNPNPTCLSMDINIILV